jgi:hypothetical protein
VTFATALSVAWGADIKPLQTSNITMNEVVCEDLSSLSGATGIWTGAYAGNRSGTPLTAQVCALVNFHIARRYRGGKPRMYLPAGVEGDLTDARTWGNTFTAAVVTGINALNAAAAAAPWSGASAIGQVNVSYYLGFASAQNPITLRWKNYSTPRATPLVDVITSASCNPLVGTQRRRISA